MLAASGAGVLAVDLDPQGNLSTAFDIDLEEIEQTRLPAHRLMPARAVLRKLNSDAEGNRRLFLRRRSERARQQTLPAPSHRFLLTF